MPERRDWLNPATIPCEVHYRNSDPQHAPQWLAHPSAANDSTPFAMPRGAFEVTPESVDLIPNESGGLPLVANRVAGTDVYWWWSGFGLRKIVWENDKLVEVARVDIPVKLPNFKAVTPDERRAQAKAVQGYLDAHDEQGLLDYMKSQRNRMVTGGEDQLANGAVYSLLTSDDRFFGCGGRQIFRIDQENPKDPRSAMKAPRTLALPDNLFDNERAKRGTRIPIDVLLEEDAVAIAIANDTDYGLAAYVASGDPERARRVAARLRAGSIRINLFRWT